MSNKLIYVIIFQSFWLCLIILFSTIFFLLIHLGIIKILRIDIAKTESLEYIHLYEGYIMFILPF
jgi:hypothetical protein